MNTLQQSRPAPGWYPDPRDPRRLRWWDGAHWTSHISAMPRPPATGSRRRRRSAAGPIAGVSLFLLVAVLLLASLYWPGFGSSLWAGQSGALPDGEAAQAPAPGGAQDAAPTSVPATDLQSAYEGAVTVEANCGQGCVGVGGGVAVSATEVLTAEHVVNDSTLVGIVDARGNTFAATVVARDARRDLALLRMRPHGLPVVSVRSDPAEIGEAAHAVGAPGGNRRISDGFVTDVLDLEGDGVMEVQTSADIDRGNSGGPLLDDQGRLLGIVVAEHEFDDTIGWATGAADVAACLPAAMPAAGAVPQGTIPLNGDSQDILNRIIEQFLGG